MTLEVNQGAIWEEVSRKQREMGAYSKTGAVNKVYETVGDKVREYKKHFAPSEGQVGVIVLINGSFSCIDLFDSAETLHKLYAKMLESYAIDALEARGEGEELPEKVEIQELIGAIGDLQLRITPSLGLGRDVRIVAKRIVGSCLVYEDRILELSAFRAEEAKNLNEGSQGAVIPPSRRRRFLGRVQ